MQTKRNIPQGTELLSLIAAFLIVLGMAALSYQGWQGYTEQREASIVSRDIKDSANDLMSSLRDAETGQRGYLITGQDRYLKPYQTAIANIPAELKTFSNAIAAGAPEQVERFNKIQPLIDEKLAELDHTIDLQKSGDAEAARNSVLSGKGNDLMDQIRQISVDIQTDAESRRARHAEGALSSVNQLGLISTAGGVALLVLLIFSTITIQRGINRRQQLIAQLQAREAEITETRDLLQTTLRCIGDAVIATDEKGKITFLNVVAELLTGWSSEEVSGKPLEKIFVISNEDTKAPVESPIERALREGRIIGLANHTVLISKDGREIPIEDSAAPIRGEKGVLLGAVLVFRDVSDRRAQERALKLSEERLALALDAGQIGVWDWDVIHNTIDWSDRVYQIHGVQRGKFGGTVADFVALIHPDDRQYIASSINASLKNGDTYNVEFRVVHPNGKIVWVLTTATVFRDDHGQPFRMLGATTDITVRKEAEESLRQQWHTFDTALSNTPDFTYVFDLQGRFTYINKALLDLWQKTFEEARGKNFFELDYPPDLAARLQKQIQEVIVTKSAVRDQTPFTGADSQARYYEYIFFPILTADGEVEGVAGSTRDITESNRAQNVLQATEERLTMALEAGGGIGTWDWDVPNDKLYCNRQFAQLFAVDPERGTFGVPIAEFLTNIHPEDRPHAEELIQQALLAGGDFEQEFRLVQPDRSLRWVHVRGRCHLDHDGKPFRFPGVAYETTERRRAEEELRDSNQSLRVANRELEEFSYVASHDLQEPLRMVNSYTQLLLRRIGPAADEEMQQCAAFIGTGVKRMETLIRDLLNYSHTAHQLTEVPKARVDLNESLQRALAMVETRIIETHAEVAADRLPLVTGDVGQFAHVFQNILSNAIKYKRPDTPVHIEITAKREGEEWIVGIKDNGIGFEQQHATRIFGLFKRLHRDEQYVGTGLGLAICKRIVERYRGRIWAESQEGQGTTFYVALPVPDDDLPMLPNQ